jgi:Zn-dependent metalloprotease
VQGDELIDSSEVTMKAARHLSWLAVLAALILVSAASARQTGMSAAGAPQKQPKGVDPAEIQRLKQNARGSVAVSTKKATEYVGFVRAGKNGDLLPSVQTQSAVAKARGFLTDYAGLFGITSQGDLVQTGVTTDATGARHLTYEQTYNGVPVFGAMLRAHVDARDNLTAVNGVFVPDIQLTTTTPKLSAGDAGARAIAAVVASPPGEGSVSPADLRVASAEVFVYRVGLIRDVVGSSQLAYVVEVTNGSSIREIVVVHAHAGKILNRWSLVDDALYRILYEQNTGNQVWQEGDPFPGSLNQDQQNIVDFSGDSYRYFFNSFGRDSYDGAGAQMRSVNNDPTINCPNANWNGATTNYCNGVTADDVVAHEWGHAYTEYTHNLIYAWQSGALNESYSDIWGETVDILNGKGTDSPGPVRTVGSCSTHTTPVPLLIINSPAAIAQECAAGAAAFGPPLTATGVTGVVELGTDGAGASTNDGCEPLVGFTAGRIALVDRGTCGFIVKVKNAQNAGAIAAIVANNAAGPPAGMGGADPTITIPSVQIAQKHGTLIKSNISAPVNVTMRLSSAGAEDSYRWLMGEDATAFGTAIRDMWKPTCKSDPGRVTDAEYHCASTDGGGVHTNSGVPNHGYALLVDGGTYNGQTISAIGLVKAAHLYWQAQSAYQTPTSNFDDHADALQASCNDLIGVPLEGLSTTSTPAGPSGQSINAGDCAAVSAMITAVELRTDPTAQCNFQPILGKSPPALCANQKNAPVIWSDNFESGVGQWTLSNQGVFSGWPNLDWRQATTLPGGRSGAAAFAENLPGGDCAGGAGDISGAMYMLSPAIHLPTAAQNSARLTFWHYAATEAGWDGGNLRISINGGTYEQVPPAAFLYNPYNMTLMTAAAGNTNPLAGERAYSGTDGGSLFGSWGQTQINLETMGADPGDTIRIRFNFGTDGCTGVDGWYVDDVKVQVCSRKKTASAKD